MGIVSRFWREDRFVFVLQSFLSRFSCSSLLLFSIHRGCSCLTELSVTSRIAPVRVGAKLHFARHAGLVLAVASYAHLVKIGLRTYLSPAHRLGTDSGGVHET